MKSRIILFFATLFFITVVAQAQPGCSAVFNPFASCAYRPDTEIVFYGEIIGIEELKNRIGIENKTVKEKATIRVEKILKGTVGQQVNVFFEESCRGWDMNVGEKHVFTVKHAKVDGTKVLFTDHWSRSMSQYSESAVEEVFSVVDMSLRQKRNHSLSGAVVLNLSKQPIISRDAETADRLNYDPYHYSPVMGITVEAQRKENGKIFRSQTDKEGLYFFDNLPDGEYKIAIALPEDFVKTYYETKVGDGSCNWKRIVEARKVQ